MSFTGASGGLIKAAMELTPRPGPWKWPRAVWALVACALLAAAGYGLYWNMLAGQFADAIHGWAEARRAGGYQVDYGDIAVGGFPFWLRAAIAEPVVSKSGEKQSWRWRGPALSISTRPWRVTRTKARAPGRHLLTVTAPGRTGTLDLNAEALNVFLNWSVLSALPLEARIEAKEVTFRSSPVAGLGRKTQILSLSAEATGVPPRSLGAAAMAHWRDDGGTVEIRKLNIRHGPLQMDGDGTIALDRDLQPQGAFSLKVRGFLEAVDGLEAAGIIKPRGAEIVKAVLSVLARGQGKWAEEAEEEAEGKRIKVPLSIQDGNFYVGPVAVGRVPPLHWPDGG